MCTAVEKRLELWPPNKKVADSNVNNYQQFNSFDQYIFYFFIPNLPLSDRLLSYCGAVIGSFDFLKTLFR